jgi:acetyl esterase/lipase
MDGTLADMGIIKSRLLRQGLVRSVVAANALSPVENSRVLTVPSFFTSWISSETAPLILGIWGLRTRSAIREQRASGGLGVADWIGLGLTAGSAAAMAKTIHQAINAQHSLRAAVSQILSEEDIDNRLGTSKASSVLPFLTSSKNCRVTRNVRFAEVESGPLRLDIYEPKVPVDSPGPRPAIIQIHGGAWVVGDKREQGIPLLRYMAANGWVGFNVNYRLSPKVKAPVHLQDCKRAIAYIREHADEYDIDPNFIAVTGGSAGGHLAAMVALTGNDPEFQPGFEGTDTSVQAAVPFYGVYDMLGREGDQEPAFVQLLERLVMDGSPEINADAWSAYSPIDQIHTGAPPMMVIHGAGDVLVPVRGARRFVARLSEVTENPLIYAELDGAQHAFDIFPSIRGNATVEYVERFLNEIHRRYVADTSSSEQATSSTV